MLVKQVTRINFLNSMRHLSVSDAISTWADMKKIRGKTIDFEVLTKSAYQCFYFKQSSWSRETVKHWF